MIMVNVQDFAQSLNLTILHPYSKDELDIAMAEINRPGLEFIGYYDHFAYDRPQVMGNVEINYLDSLSQKERAACLERFFSFPLPCIIVCRGLTPPEELMAQARLKDVPVFQSQISTTTFIVQAILYLARVLAPRTTRHAVLVDVYGVGILITGESGVGKSESALELIKRGHQLVADDIVDIRRVSNDRLVGEAPETTRHFMEIRGIGIIDIRAMYGVGSVLLNKSIDMEIHLENWKEKKEYDRLGLKEETNDIMGVSLPYLVIPVRPGRNLAIIIEVAARNFSLKKMGYSAARELDRRLNDMMNNSRKEQG
ncbi:MAG: HPr kinase/phosphorylase [Clostridiales bacterium]|nr:HPr kinase/phosphorylase [Clostridiales bacterium]